MTAPVSSRLSHRGAVAAVITAAVAVVIGVEGYHVTVGDHGQDPAEAAAQAAIGWTFVASGLIGWWRRPRSTVGPLLAAAGVALLVRRLQYSDDSSLFTLGFALGELSNVLIAHAVLGYPTGRVRGKVERSALVAGYVLVLLLPVATLLFYDPSTSCFFSCGEGPRAHSLIAVTSQGGMAEALRDAYRLIVFGALGVAFLVLVARRLVLAGKAGRMLLAPVLVAGILAAIRAVSEGALTFSSYSAPVHRGLFWWQLAVQAAIPLALIVGLMRARLARATVADALPALGGARTDEVRDVLARVLRDDSLELAFWLPERREYVDERGDPFVLPTDDDRRMATPIGEPESPVAILVHDPILAEEPGLVEDTAAAAGLALENARLQAELRAQLAAVRESRARVAAAADEERRRIERDLHDGAQQRLLAIALELRSTEHRHRGGLDPEIQLALAGAVDELQGAVEDLRRLAHGLHPSILAEQGLEPALAVLAARSSVPVALDVDVTRRLPGGIEATAYFVVSEALVNIEKHAGATRASVRAAAVDGALRLEIADDGRGGADATASGLRGLADRVESHGGRFRVTSGAEGTTLAVELPCAS